MARKSGASEGERRAALAPEDLFEEGTDKFWEINDFGNEKKSKRVLTAKA
jgi:hypothetical protein